MRAVAGLALGMALAAATVSAQPGPGRPPLVPLRQSYANPSAVIAAELALSRLAREKGQWRALHDAAAPGAVLFVPRAVPAATWLKRRPEPPESQRWSPRIVWMSCDGDYAVSQGTWTRGRESGEYVAVWERQEKGEWKWLLREESEAGKPAEATEMIAGRVAECSGLPRRRRPDELAPILPIDAASDDRSLRWRVEVAPDCARSVRIEAWNGKALVPLLAARRNPPATGCS